jgi:hypothetical protein
MLGCLTFYFDEEASTTPNTTSGETHRFYDKLHSNYVYLTETENDLLLVLFCVAGMCILFSIVVDFDLKRSVARSQKIGEQSENSDFNDSTSR